MANEIQWRHTATGSTLYATIRSKTGTQWNTAGTPNFEAVTAANWADYDIALSEGVGNYFYTGTFPAISGNMVAGWYWVDIYDQAGAGPAIDDTLLGTIVGYWDGTTFGPWDANMQQVKGTTSPADAGYVAPDWGQVKNPTTTVALTNTTINDSQKVDLNTAKTRAVGDVGVGNTAHLLQSADSGATAVSRLTAAQAADAVWDEAKSEHTTAGTFGLWLGTKLWNWLGALMGKTADTATRAEINATTAGAGYNETTDSLEAQADAATTAGTGSRAVVFTVTTGGVALLGASVRLYRTGSVDRTGTTNASGQVTLYCDVDATWSYVVTHPLYSSGSGTVVVDGNEAVPVSLTALSWPDSTEADTVTVRWRVKKADRTYCGAAEGTVYLQIIDGPGTAGFIYHGDNEDFDSETTDANGYVNFTNVPIPCTIAIKTGTSRKLKTFEIPSTATSPYDAGELVSHDA